MTDLFIYADHRALLARWDFHLSILRIVARDYRLVLNGERQQDRHRTILIQTANTMMDLVSDLARLGHSSPESEMDPTTRSVWDSLAPLVWELRTWRPTVDMPPQAIRDALRRRKVLDEQLMAAIGGRTASATDEPVFSGSSSDTLGENTESPAKEIKGLYR